MSEPFEFLIEVVDRIAEGYRLRVAFPDPDSPTGVGENRTVTPFDPADAELRGRLAVLPTSVLASAARARSAMNPLEEAARDVGDRLFRAVTVGETLGDLSRLRRRALAAGADVRISLRIQPPELAALPWEFLFDARSDKLEFLGRSCMVTRSAGAFGAVPRLAVDGPLRVLAMVSLPGDQAALDARREQDGLTRALAPMAAARRVELHWIPATKQALLAATQSGTWHAFHYIGHGDFDAAAGEGRLAFTGPDGGTDPVSARQLATILGTHPTLRLAVLNACQTSRSSGGSGGGDGRAGVAEALVHAGLPAVVAMQFPITDDAAPVFSQAFYEALAAGRGVDQCVRAGRTAITLANDSSLEWGTPVLHLRSADGVLFGFARADTTTVAISKPSAPRVLSETDAQLAETMLVALPKSVTSEEELASEEDKMLATMLRGALMTLTYELIQAQEAMKNGAYDEALVAKLEEIVAAFVAEFGEDHANTERAESALSKARRGLDQLRRLNTAPAPQQVAMRSSAAPASPASESEEVEDAPRRKTVRAARSQAKKGRAAVTVTEGLTLWVRLTRVRSLAAASVGGMLRVAVGGDDGVVTIHASVDARTQPSSAPHELRHTESGPDGRGTGPAPVSAIGFDPGGQTVACLAGSGTPPEHLVVWDMAAVRPRELPGGVFAYLPGSKPGAETRLVSSVGFSQLGVRSVHEDAAAAVPLPGVETVFAVAASRDGRYIAAVGQNRARVWTGDGELIQHLPCVHRSRHIAFTPDGDHVVVAESPTTLAVYDVESGVRTARFPIDPYSSDAWEAGGSGLLATTAPDGLLLWDLTDSARPVQRIPGNFATTVRPAFTPAGDVLVARNMDGHHVHTFSVDVVPAD